MKFHEPNRISELLKNYQGLWAIAGGWAIDLFLDKETRDHQDIEIIIPRNDQLKMQKYLKDWSFQYLNDGQLVEWNKDEYLELPFHEIHGGDKNGNKLEVLLNEVSNEVWKYRRHFEITCPISKLILNSKNDIPILCPEIVLLYKAKVKMPKDLADLRITLAEMNDDSIAWLKHSIGSSHGENQEWIMEIQKSLNKASL